MLIVLHEKSRLPRQKSAAATDHGISHDQPDTLNLIICGSVDDGKSTLLGRMLYDSKMVMADQIAALDSVSRKFGTTGSEYDLALLVDGLQAEMEQGITIDVAYRFFNTQRRRFIVADVPGHEQYTRNMVTGASNAMVAIILVDSRKGLSRQTRRHTHIAKLMGINHFVIAVNKMDAVDYSEQTFTTICAGFAELATRLAIDDYHLIPISALNGDNVVRQSKNMSWYNGYSLLTTLEDIEVDATSHTKQFVFPVQWVNRPNDNFRGYAGTIAAGSISVGDEVTVMPSGHRAKVASILAFDQTMTTAAIGAAITITLDREIAIRRGDLLCSDHGKNNSGNDIMVGDSFAADIVWLDDHGFNRRHGNYILRCGHQWQDCKLTAINYRLDIETMAQVKPYASDANDANDISDCINVNDIARVVIKTSDKIVFSNYRYSRELGGFIIVDRQTNATVACGMIRWAGEADKPGGNLTIKQIMFEGQQISMRVAAPQLIIVQGDDYSKNIACGKEIENLLLQSGSLAYMMSSELAGEGEKKSAKTMIDQPLTVKSDQVGASEIFADRFVRDLIVAGTLVKAGLTAIIALGGNSEHDMILARANLDRNSLTIITL